MLSPSTQVKSKIKMVINIKAKLRYNFQIFHLGMILSVLQSEILFLKRPLIIQILYRKTSDILHKQPLFNTCMFNHILWSGLSVHTIFDWRTLQWFLKTGRGSQCNFLVLK